MVAYCPPRCIWNMTTASICSQHIPTREDEGESQAKSAPVKMGLRERQQDEIEDKKRPARRHCQFVCENNFNHARWQVPFICRFRCIARNLMSPKSAKSSQCMMLTRKFVKWGTPSTRDRHQEGNVLRLCVKADSSQIRGVAHLPLRPRPPE